MRTIFRIARTELALFFYSPLAWLLLAVFMFQASGIFLHGVQQTIASIKVHFPVSNLSQYIYGSKGLFGSMLDTLYFYIPLLTMGLLARETHSGSIKLLQSSPVSAIGIVLGKFLGIILFGLLLVTLLGIFVFVGALTIQHCDVRLLLAGMLGLYLVICAYFSIGLLMSCITSYQVVAAVGTFTVLAGLDYIKGAWQNVPVIRDITYMLSISGRSTDMIGGLVSTKDIVYFLVVIGLALGYAILYLHFRRYSASWFRRGGCYLLLTVVLVLVGWLTSRPKTIFYYDMTASKRNTISSATQEIIKKIKGPLKITTFVNVLDGAASLGQPKNKNADLRFFEPYQRFLKESLDIRYVYYYDSSEAIESFRDNNNGKSDSAIASTVGETYGIDPRIILSPLQIRQLIDPSKERGRYFRVLEANGRQSRLRIYNDIFHVPSEDEIGAALKELVEGPTHVAVAVNNRMRSVSGMAKSDYEWMSTEIFSRRSLVNQGFSFEEFSLDSIGVPWNTDILLLADPKAVFSPVAAGRIADYIKRGGNLIVTAQPGDAFVVNPVLKAMGMRFDSGILLQGDSRYEPDFIRAQVDENAHDMSWMWDELNKAQMSFPRTYITMPGAMTVSRFDFLDRPFSVRTVLTTDSMVWNRKGRANLDSGYVSFVPGLGDRRASWPVGVALTRQWPRSQQRIFLVGNAQCLSTAEITRQNMPTRNMDFAQALFGWLGEDKYPINTNLPQPIDNDLRIERQQMPLLIGILKWGIPIGLLLAGGSLLLYRRQK